MKRNSPTSRTCCSTVLPSVPEVPPMKARYRISIFVVSVLPAPLSPLTKMDWLPCSFIIALIIENDRISLQIYAFISSAHCNTIDLLNCRCTCNNRPQQQKDVGLALQKWLLYIAPSCGHRTSVAVSGKD